MDAEAVLDAARKAADSYPFVFLTTIAPDGAPSARLVQALEIDDDFTIWFATSPRSRKLRDLRINPNCLVSIEDRTGYGYVVLYGKAKIEEDPKVAKHLWIDDLEPFYPGGPTGGDYVAVAVRPERIELVHFVAGIHPEPYGLVPAVIERGGPDEWELVDPVRGEEPW